MKRLFIQIVSLGSAFILFSAPAFALAASPSLSIPAPAGISSGNAILAQDDFGGDSGGDGGGDGGGDDYYTGDSGYSGGYDSSSGSDSYNEQSNIVTETPLVQNGQDAFAQTPAIPFGAGAGLGVGNVTVPGDTSGSDNTISQTGYAVPVDDEQISYPPPDAPVYTPAPSSGQQTSVGTDVYGGVQDGDGYAPQVQSGGGSTYQQSFGDLDTANQNNTGSTYGSQSQSNGGTYEPYTTPGSGSESYPYVQGNTAVNTPPSSGSESYQYVQGNTSVNTPPSSGSESSQYVQANTAVNTPSNTAQIQQTQSPTQTTDSTPGGTYQPVNEIDTNSPGTTDNRQPVNEIDTYNPGGTDNTISTIKQGLGILTGGGTTGGSSATTQTGGPISASTPGALPYVNIGPNGGGTGMIYATTPPSDTNIVRAYPLGDGSYALQPPTPQLIQQVQQAQSIAVTNYATTGAGRTANDADLAGYSSTGASSASNITQTSASAGTGSVTPPASGNTTASYPAPTGSTPFNQTVNSIASGATSVVTTTTRFVGCVFGSCPATQVGTVAPYVPGRPNFSATTNTSPINFLQTY